MAALFVTHLVDASHPVCERANQHLVDTQEMAKAAAQLHSERRIKVIGELKDALFKACGGTDHRFRGAWARRVTAVDSSLSTGYCFEGEFVNYGTVEYNPGPAVYLVKTVNGSNRYHPGTYTAVLMNEHGELKGTDVTTTDQERGWALRIREGVAKLLESFTAPASKCMLCQGPVPDGARVCWACLKVEAAALGADLG